MFSRPAAVEPVDSYDDRDVTDRLGAPFLRRVCRLLSLRPRPALLRRLLPSKRSCLRIRCVEGLRPACQPKPAFEARMAGWMT
eukprot:364323-Chlamydomonas_euryale.AAC.24